MRMFFISIFIPCLVKAQCPDPDPILQRRSMTWPIQFHHDIPYTPDFNWTSVVVSVTPVNGKLPLPPVNQDPNTGKKTWLKNGFCRIYYPDTEDTVLLATGRYLNGKKTGSWTWYHANGAISHEGRYVNGLKTGTWTEYDENHEWFGTGVFAAGRKQGQWQTMTSDSIPINKRMYNQGLLHGKEETYTNGRLEQQYMYAYGLYHGKCITYDRDNISVIQHFTQGTITSAWYYNEGKLLSKTEYQGNKRTETVYEGNQKTIVHYNGDDMQGWFLRYVDGVLTTKQYYHKNNLHGYSMAVDGDEKTICYYKSGELHGTFTRYKKLNNQWQLRQQAYYVNGQYEGAYTDRGEDGSVLRARYKEGRLHGLEYILSQTGDTLSSALYVDGKITGRALRVSDRQKTICWYESGSKTHEVIYVDNQLTSEKFFRNGYEYKRSQSKIYEDGTLQEEITDADGKLKTRRHFDPEGTNRMKELRFFPSGKLKHMALYVSHRKTQEVLLNEQGDTLEYENQVNWLTEGKRIKRYKTSAGHGYVFKGHYNQGQANGPAEIFYADTVIENGLKKTTMALAATGYMYKDQAMLHWDIYYADGTKKYQGCLCGTGRVPAETTVFYTSVLLPFEDPGQVLQKFVSCGDHVLYHPNGLVKEKRQNNQVEVYDEDGVLREQGNFKNEQKHGIWHVYDKTGKEIRQEHFENGFQVKTILP